MKLFATWLLLFLGFSPSAVRAEPPRSVDWPMFRGNSALLGVTSNKLPEKLSLLWTFKTTGAVKSSAVIADGRVFVGSGDGHLYALNFNTGEKIWNYKTEGPVDAPPLFARETVFVGSVDGFLYSLEAKTGKLNWKYKTEDKILGAPNWVEGREAKIESKTNSTLNSQPSTTNFSVLIGSYDTRLHSVDALTGKSNWVFETGNYINGSPAVADGKTVFGGCDALLHVVSVIDGKKIKQLEAGAYVAASVALTGNRAYFGHYDNEFLCIDLGENKNSETNSNVIWRYKNRDFAYFSSAAVTSDKVIFGGRDKLLHCLNRADGKVIWTFPTRGKVDSSPVVANDKVVVGSHDGRVYIVSLQEGKELWSYEIGQPIDSSPAVADGKIVIGCDDGNVYCFGEKRK